jgi:hypothetical protein
LLFSLALVGQTSFTSRLTNQTEWLPTCIGISSGKGSDVMLTDLIDELVSETQSEDVRVGATPFAVSSSLGAFQSVESTQQKPLGGHF